MKVAVTIEIDTDRLSSYVDSYLVGLYHVAQLNPAPMEDLEAGKLADRIKDEIVRRWLKDTPGEAYSHSEGQAYWRELTKHCIWDGKQWVPRPVPQGQEEPPC